jgi:hypothetical protein
MNGDGIGWGNKIVKILIDLFSQIGGMGCSVGGEGKRVCLVAKGLILLCRVSSHTLAGWDCGY